MPLAFFYPHRRPVTRSGIPLPHSPFLPMPHPSRPKLFTTSYCCILAANFLLYFGFWLLIPLLPFYLKEVFSQPEGAIGLILSCYTLSALMVRPFSGYLLDTFARKPLYILAYAIFTALFSGYALCTALPLFIVLRVLHGFAFGAVTVGGNTVVVDIMPSERRGEGLGYYGLTNNIAMSIGPMVGLFLHRTLTFNHIFLISLAACTVGLLMAACVRTKPKPKVKRPPLSLDRFVLTRGIPASISLLLLSIPYGATTNFVAMYVEEMRLAVTPGFYFVMMALGMGISRIFSGKYVDRGYVTECIHYGLFLATTAFALLGCCEYINGLSQGAARALFYLVPLIQGIGFGIMFPAFNSLYINLGTNNQRATATSTYLTAWDVGIGAGIVLSGLIAQLFSFAAVYLTGAVLSLLSMTYFNRAVTPHYHKYRLR